MRNYDVIILVDSGIGNAIEALYAIEYCIENKIKAGIFLNRINRSFQEYLKECYSGEVILTSLKTVRAKHLLHSFTYHDEFEAEYDNYFYVQPDANSSRYKSETEQYLEIVRALYPSDYDSKTLKHLKADFSTKVKELNSENKYIIYPGSTYPNAYKRWPYYPELINKLGEENCIVIGGNDDLRSDYSYIYPKYISKPLPQPVLDNIHFWRFLKKIKLLKPYAHNENLKDKAYSYFNEFNWPELIAIFQSAKTFVGNDGGLAQIAASVGAKGVVLFGATSVEKNKAYNPEMKPIHLNFECQPCQFAKGGIQSKKYYINCPFQIKCMYKLSVEKVFNALQIS